MNRKEALEILDFRSSDNPSEYEIRKAYRKLALEYHPDKHSSASEDVQKQNEEKFKQLGAAYEFLTKKNIEEVTKLTDENLDEINSPEDLKFHLYAALLRQDIAFLKKLFSKFKSSEDGKFGDYINEKHFGNDFPLFSAISSGNVDLVRLLLENGADHDIRGKYGKVPLRAASLQVHYKIVELLLKHGAGKESESLNEALRAAVECREHWHEREKVVELLLKYGANPNASTEYYTARVIERDSYLASNSVTGFIKIFFLPYGSNNKARKLMAEYGGVSRDYILF